MARFQFAKFKYSGTGKARCVHRKVIFLWQIFIYGLLAFLVEKISQAERGINIIRNGKVYCLEEIEMFVVWFDVREKWRFRQPREKNKNNRMCERLTFQKRQYKQKKDDSKIQMSKRRE